MSVAPALALRGRIGHSLLAVELQIVAAQPQRGAAEILPTSSQKRRGKRWKRGVFSSRRKYSSGSRERMLKQLGSEQQLSRRRAVRGNMRRRRRSGKPSNRLCCKSSGWHGYKLPRGDERSWSLSAASLETVIEVN